MYINVQRLIVFFCLYFCLCYCNIYIKLFVVHGHTVYRLQKRQILFSQLNN